MSDKIEWKDSYLLGIPMIDEQHKQLLKLANDLYDVATGPESEFKQKFQTVLKALVDYTVYHFSNEEKFMKEYGYVASDAHKVAHDGFISEVNMQVKALDNADGAAGLRFYKYMVTWVMTHIARADPVWAKFVLAQQK